MICLLKKILIASTSLVMLLSISTGFIGTKASAAELSASNSAQDVKNDTQELLNNLDYNSFAADYEVNGVQIFDDNYIEVDNTPAQGSLIVGPVNGASNPGGIQIMSAGSYAAKKGLKWAVNNTTAITNFVGRTLGKKAAVKVGNVMHSYVKPALKKLERVENLTYGKIEDAIYDALKKPLGKTGAKVAANVIVEAIEILSPV